MARGIDLGWKYKAQVAYLGVTSLVGVMGPYLLAIWLWFHGHKDVAVPLAIWWHCYQRYAELGVGR